MKSRIVQIRNVVVLYAFILVVWGFYRALFRLPEGIEELVLKPLVWIGPLVFVLRREGVGFASVGYTRRNLFKSIYLGVGLGVLFLLVAIFSNLFKYKGVLSFSGFGFTEVSFIVAIFVSLVTSVVEETVFRGYLFNRVWMITGGEFLANFLVSAGWGLVHLPVLVFAYDLGVTDVFLRFLLTSIFGVGSAFVFARTRNITSSVLLRFVWSWPIVLFRYTHLT